MAKQLISGQKVVVTHLQGQEAGEVESVNYKTGKVLVFFNYKDCPHYDSFNLDQVEPYSLKVSQSKEIQIEKG